MLTADQKETVETLFFGKVLGADEDLDFFQSQFKYLGPLGKGAFAIVVAAKWLKHGDSKAVAVKCFCKEDFESNTIEQFRKEAKITQGNDHKNILSSLAVKESAKTDP